MREGFSTIHPVALLIYGSISVIALIGAPLIGQNIAQATKTTSPEVAFDLVLYQVDPSGALQAQTTDQGLSLDDCVAILRQPQTHPLGTPTLVTCQPGHR